MEQPFVHSSLLPKGESNLTNIGIRCHRIGQAVTLGNAAIATLPFVTAAKLAGFVLVRSISSSRVRVLPRMTYSLWRVSKTLLCKPSNCRRPIGREHLVFVRDSFIILDITAAHVGNRPCLMRFA